MNCELLQRRLLASEQPDQPSEESQAHLAECLPCQDWHRQLVQMEESLRFLPVPVSAAKGVLLRRTLADGPTTLPFQPQSLLAPERVRNKERGMQKTALAFAIAASLVICAFGAWVWKHDQERGPIPSPNGPTVKVSRGDPFLAKLMQRYPQLAVPGTPKERVATFSGIAKDFEEEVLTRGREVLPVESDSLKDLVAQYIRVIDEGLVQQARLIPKADRRAVLEPIASQLLRVKAQAEALTHNQNLPQDSVSSLQDMAKAADRANEQLRLLIERT